MASAQVSARTPSTTIAPSDMGTASSLIVRVQDAADDPVSPPESSDREVRFNGTP